MRNRKKVTVDLEEGLATVRIAVVSATCRDKKLMEGFQAGFWSVVNGSGKEFTLNIFDKGADPKKLWSDHDLIITDSVITWGGKPTLLPKLRKLAENGKQKCSLLILPRKSSERIPFFKNPQNLANALVGKLKPGKVEVPPPMAPKEEWDDDPIKNFVFPALRVLVAFNGSFGKEEAAELTEVLKQILPEGTHIVIGNKLKRGLFRNTDLIFTSPYVEHQLIASTIKNRRFTRAGAEKVEYGSAMRGLSSKQTRFQNLNHVARALEVNPRMKVILVDRELSQFLVNYRHIASGFLEYPFVESSVRVLLHKAVKEMRL